MAINTNLKTSIATLIVLCFGLASPARAEGYFQPCKAATGKGLIVRTAPNSDAPAIVRFPWGQELFGSVPEMITATPETRSAGRNGWHWQRFLTKPTQRTLVGPSWIDAHDVFCPPDMTTLPRTCRSTTMARYGEQSIYAAPNSERMGQLMPWTPISIIAETPIKGDVWYQIAPLELSKIDGWVYSKDVVCSSDEISYQDWIAR